MHSILKLIFCFFVLAACSCKQEIDALQSQRQIAGYNLVWSDEFEGAYLDTTKWEFQTGDDSQNRRPKGLGNDEFRWHTRSNCEVRDGNLIITLREEKKNEHNYTSCGLRSLNKGDWKYGRFEIRAKLACEHGLSSVIWMLPSKPVYGRWAASGEIDIMEMFGHENNKVYGTIHYGNEWPGNIKHGTSFKLPEGDFSSEFHVFRLEWEDDEIRWYVDDTHYQTLNEWYSQGNVYPAPFDQPFYLLLNIAVDGNCCGKPGSSTHFPRKMIVDYVRVYKKNQG